MAWFETDSVLSLALAGVLGSGSGVSILSWLSRGVSSLGLAAGRLHLPSPLRFLRDDAFDNIVNLEVKWGQGMAQLTPDFH